LPDSRTRREWLQEVGGAGAASLARQIRVRAIGTQATHDVVFTGAPLEVRL
jgi:hypothetical protein